MTPKLGVTMISGVRGSASGGLKRSPSAGPENISPIPASEASASSIATALLVWFESESQRSATSSAVGPIPFGLFGDSEKGSRELTIEAGDLPLLPLGPGIGTNRFGSTGDWPC